MHENLQKLKELTEKLSPLTDLISKETDNFIEYGDSGFTALGLYNVPEIAVSKITINKGKKAKEHNHKEKEIGIIYKGCISFIIDGKEKDYHPGDIVYFNPMQMHSAHAKEDSEAIFITIPSGEGFPNARW